jgi:tetratricopeptide (TPR) repeat protein
MSRKSKRHLNKPKKIRKLAKKGRPADIVPLLQQAVQFQKSGQISEAEEAYNQVLRIDPANRFANQLLGGIAMQQGDFARAVDLIGKALAVDPDNAELHNNMGNSLAETGRHREAIIHYNRALILQPGYPQAHNNLGAALRALGKPNDAVAHHLKVLEIQPDNALAHNNYANTLKDLERTGEAVKHYNLALQLNPGYAEAHYNLGVLQEGKGQLQEASVHYKNALNINPDYSEANYNLGNTLRVLGKPEEAIVYYRKALDSNPEFAEAHFNLGIATEGTGNVEEATEQYTRALELNPDLAEASYYLGNALRTKGPSEAAVKHLNDAIGSQPEHAEAHNNLGHVLRQMGKRKEAEAHWRRAVELKPDFADAQINLGLVHFEQGDLSQGWQRYEWRDKASSYLSTHRHFKHPLWDGTPLKDKEIILWGEQGLGDEILYASMIPDVLKQGAKVTIECTERLVDLFSRSFAGAEVHAFPYASAEHGKRHYDFHCSFPSLGRFIRPTLDSFPTLEDEYAFLKSDPEKQAFWQARLAAMSARPKIGLNWNSSVVKDDSRHFYASIKEMEPLLKTPGVDFISLVYADAEADIAQALQDYGVAIHTWEDLDLKDDIDGVAALMSSLDLVVSCLSTVSELSGALGLQTLGFIGETAHTIMLGTDDVMWSPNTHYHSKEMNDPWEPVFVEISASLCELFNLQE